MLVLGVLTSEDEAVIAVLQVGKDLPKHGLDGVTELHLLHLHFESLLVKSVRVYFKVFRVRLHNVLLEVPEPLVQRPGSEVGLAVKDKAVEHQKVRFFAPVAEIIHHQLPVNQRVDVEVVSVLRRGEVHVFLFEPPVVVLAVDQIMGFFPVVTLGQIEQVTDAVGLLADVVTI